MLEKVEQIRTLNGDPALLVTFVDSSDMRSVEMIQETELQRLVVGLYPPVEEEQLPLVQKAHEMMKTMDYAEVKWLMAQCAALLLA